MNLKSFEKNTKQNNTILFKIFFVMPINYLDKKFFAQKNFIGLVSVKKNNLFLIEKHF